MLPGSGPLIFVSAPGLEESGQKPVLILPFSASSREFEEVLSKRLGNAPLLSVETTALEDEPPLPPKALAPRTNTVEAIIGQISRVAWISLVAATGFGKTQLARLTKTNYQNGKSIWITVPEQEQRLAVSHIHNRLMSTLVVKSRLATEDIPTTNWHIAIAKALGQNALVIIDDLPALDAKEALLSYLCSLALALQNFGSTLISTSKTHLSVFVSERLADKFTEIAVPPFELADIVSLLNTLNAPAHIHNDKVTTLILASTSGHPTLVSATLSWLQNKQWNLNLDVLDQLLGGDPVKDVREETMRILPRLLPDEETRQFLYRLSVFSYPFDERLARVVAEIAPPIALPGEKLMALHGPWLSRTPRNTYQLSPLLSRSGEANLPVKLIENIHVAAADELLSRSPIPADQVLNIVLHLFASNQGERLAIFLIQALSNVKTQSQAEYFGWVTGLFLADAPKQIVSPNLMVMVRAMQVHLELLSKSKSTELLADLDRRLSQLDLTQEENVFAALFAYANTGPLLDNAPPTLGIVQAVNFARLVRSWPKLVGSLPNGYELIWFPLMRLGRLDEYQTALEVMETLQSDELHELLTHSLDEMTVYIWMDRIWQIAAEPGAENADWKAVLRIISQLEQIGVRNDEVPLLVAALRARAIVYADYLKQTEKALQTLKNPPRSLTPSQAFIISYTTASILCDASRISEASGEYQKALDTGNEAFDYYRFDALRRMAEISGHKSEWGVSADWCMKGIRFARKSKIIPVEDEIELLAELAWIRWSEGKRKRATGAMYAVSVKLAQFDDVLSNPRRKEVMLKVGHVLGWMAYTADNATSPLLTVEGETYVSPFPGMISRRREKLAEVTRPGIEYLFMQLGLLAEKVCAYRIAYDAYEIACRRATAQELQLLSGTVNFLRAGLVSRYLPPAQVLDIALSGAMSFGVGQTLGLTCQYPRHRVRFSG